MNIRLDKYLADTGHGTRSGVKQLIKAGKVTVDGTVEKDPGRRIDTEKNIVTCMGEEAAYEEYEYYMLYKPAGIISASRDGKEKTVVDLITSKKRRDLFPVGRLDRDTEGLLIITNDGQFSHKLLAPGKHVAKVYLAIISGNLPRNATELFENGIDIGDDKPTKPAELRIFEQAEDTGDERILEIFSKLNESHHAVENASMGDSDSETSARNSLPKDLHTETTDKTSTIYTVTSITLTEGRYHEIKRMFEALGCKVEYLKRISMGSYSLNKDLKPGDYIPITPE